MARCYSIIDLGTQTTTGAFGTKEQRKIRVIWELPDEKAVFDEAKGEEPFTIAKEYTLSLYEKANLRHDLESWRGKPFTAEELKGFDISKLIGAPCLLSIIHKTAKSGNEYAAIASVSSLPKGMKCPDQYNKRVEYSIEDGQNTTFLALPKWLQETIMKAAEWDNGNAEPTEPSSYNDDEEIPF